MFLLKINVWYFTILSDTAFNQSLRCFIIFVLCEFFHYNRLLGILLKELFSEWEQLNYVKLRPLQLKIMCSLNYNRLILLPLNYLVSSFLILHNIFIIRTCSKKKLGKLWCLFEYLKYTCT